MFTALKDVSNALRWIHECGWVYRDTSVGNLYLFEGRGLIGDLDTEYAKRKLDNVPHEIGTTLIDFMAVEVVARAHLHHRVKKGGNSDRDRENIKMKADDLVKLGRSAVSLFFDKRQLQKDPIPPFFHNDIHDMESLWWISIWKLSFFRDKSETETDEKAAERQLATEDLFPRTLNTSQRSSFLRAQSRFKEKTAWFPSSFRWLRVALNSLRVVMLACYENYEASFPDIRETTIDGLHENFREEFLYCVVLAGDIELEPVKTTAGIRCAEAEARDDSRPSQSETPTNADPPHPSAQSTPSLVHAYPSSAEEPIVSSSARTHGSKQKADDADGDDMICPQHQLHLNV